MRLVLRPLACLLAIVGIGASAQTAPLTAFVDVRVETMTDAEPIERGHVIVEGGRIVSVEAGNPPSTFAGARIEGHGQTLMPGLADMHVHYYESDIGAAYLANGITVVRNLTGSLQSATRDYAARLGALVGPRVYTSGPIVDGGEPFPNDFFIRVQNPDQAIGAVRSQARSGYRAVKLYGNLSPESYRAAAAEARANGMKIFSHVPDTMSVNELLDLKIDSIEHLDGYAKALARDDFRTDRDQAWAEYWANADRSKFTALAKRTAEAGTWSVPTFAITYGRIHSADPDEYFSRPEAAYLPLWADSWRQSAAAYETDRPFFAKGLQEKEAFLAALKAAGADVLIGTDGPNPFVTPGYAIHDELRAFSDAGYTNREILRIATVEAARFMGEAGRSGVVAVGARADLVLLDGDPVADLAVLKRPTGVMVNGFWHDRATIDHALAQRAFNVAAERAKRTK